MQSKILFYVNQIYMDEPTGQGSFERGLIESLLGDSNKFGNIDIRVFSVHRPGLQPKPSDTSSKIKTLPLDKDNYWGYIAHQCCLFWVLGRELWRCRKKNVSLYVRYNPSMVSSALLAFLFRRRLVFRTGPVFQSMKVYKPDLNTWVYRFVAPGLWLFCKKAHKIVVITKRVGELVTDSFPFAARKILVVPNGANTNKFSRLPPKRDTWQLPNDAFVFGYIGHIDVDQGLQVFIRAMAQACTEGVKVPHLLVVGDGPNRREWQQLAVKLNLSEYIVWAGSRPHHEIPLAIAACDVMLLPLTKHSLDVRGTSATKLFEYLACDKSVLASRCEDLDFLEKNKIGWLIEPEDVEAWASAILQLTNMDRAALNLKGRARDLILKEYSFDAVAEKIWSACFD